MRATIRARLESRPVATTSVDLFIPDLETTRFSPAVTNDVALALPQPPSPPRPAFESIGPGPLFPELARPEASPVSRDAMCA
jgi:hypothetical protein